MNYLVRRLAFLGLFFALALPAFGQTGTVMPAPKFTAFTNAGAPCDGCKLYTYAAGTTTLQNTYPNSSLTPGTENTNPIVLDSAGRATVYLSPTSYRFDLYTSANVLIWSVDNVRSISPFANLDVSGTAGEAISAGNVVYLSDGSGGLTVGRWYKADATNAYSSSTAVVVGMAPNAISIATSGTIRLAGSLTMPSASLTTGTAYYASGTPGALTSTAPANSRLIGLADSTSTIILRIQTTTPSILPLGCQGRITLTSGTAVTTSDVTAAATVYYTPYKGDRCSLYDSANWQTVTFTEKSLALGTDTTGFNYDLFGYLSSGTLAIERLVWTNDTTRATTLTLMNGLWTKTGDSTRLYLGTYRTTGAGQTEDSNAKRFVWNNFGRVPRRLMIGDATATWSYSTATWRQARAQTTNQVAFVVGLLESQVTVTVNAAAQNGNAGIQIAAGVGINSTTVPSAFTSTLTDTINVNYGMTATIEHVPAVGFSFDAWLEISAATPTTTWVGSGTTLGGVGYTSGLQGFIH